MKIKEVTVLDKSKDYIIASVKYSVKRIFGEKIIVRKAFRKASSGLWSWLDNEELIYFHMDSLDAVVSTNKETYEI